MLEWWNQKETRGFQSGRKPGRGDGHRARWPLIMNEGANYRDRGGFTLSPGEQPACFENRWEYSSENTRFQIDRPKQLDA